jgi:erythronate-4-phosphate dehydrogenase
MKVVIDNKIPYIRGVFEPFATVVYLPGKETTSDVVRDADAIVTRTRTKCNENLLAGSSVKMVATATIGYDHIDTQYCEKMGIDWVNSPGCNSWSVAQYMMSALYTLSIEKGFDLAKMTIGIIGAGNVGAKVARFCALIGMNVLINDPPRERVEGKDGFVSLDEIKGKADIITVHTPLQFEGIDKTFHLVDEGFIDDCKKRIYLINAARGEVVDGKAVLQALTNGKIIDLIFDCWEREPDIDHTLLEKAFIATPHIAGYSRDGKATGTAMVVQAISRKFNLGIDYWRCDEIELPENPEIHIDGTGKGLQQIIGEVVLHTYSIKDDSDRLKKSRETFEKQRGDYPVRREFPAYTVIPVNIPESIVGIIRSLGFNI